MKKLLVFIFFLQSHHQTTIIAFYNLENFYDTVNNPLVNDDDFTPMGNKHYTGDIYRHKVNNLASVISKIGSDISPTLFPVILGVAEIENDTVLNDLTHHPLLKRQNYQVIHYDSKDARGIDVALLYNPHYFSPEKAETLYVPLPGNSKEAYHTRDILYVKGKLGGETIHVYVNHWPSRRGGEIRSIPARKAAATVCRRHIDNIQLTHPDAKIIVMGDLNDDPDSPSVTQALRAKGKPGKLAPGDLYNPWDDLYQQGIGTLANRDAWGLFDQIILSQSWLNAAPNALGFHSRHIFSHSFMKEPAGRYKGYPMRTWDGNNYRGGYSDHFPTYIVLTKNVN